MHKYKQLTSRQREQLEVLVRIGTRKSEIADLIDVHRSTIYRELKRNSSKFGKYNAAYAQQYTNDRKERFNLPRKLDSLMERQIRQGILDRWSPEQIHGYYTSIGQPMLSHEQIYRYIYEDKNNGGQLYTFLRIASKPYRKKYGSYKRRCKIRNRVSIDQRPEVVDQRKRAGDWEADTIVGKQQKGAILTLVERRSLFVQMSLLERRLAEKVKTQMINLLAPYKKVVKTITSDNGSEFSEHQAIAKKLDVDFYFTHPYSAWEKGTNENMNGLIRQYVPKDTWFKTLTMQQIKRIEYELNSRPRKTLGWKTPLQVFMANFTNHPVALGS